MINLALIALIAWYIRGNSQETTDEEALANPSESTDEDAVIRVIILDQQSQRSSVSRNVVAYAVADDQRKHPLMEGKNTLPPGQYTLLPEKASHIQLRGISKFKLVGGDEREVELSVQQLSLNHPFQYPIIPDKPGWIRYNLTLTSPTPAGKNAGSAQTRPYQVTIRRLGNETSDPTLCWLETEIKSSGFTEHSLLLVDPQRYINEQELQIHRGWVWIETPEHALDLLEQDIGQFAVEYSSRIDRIERLTEDWHFSLPGGRLSTQDLISLYFGANQPCANAAFHDVRSLFGAGMKREQSRSVELQSRGEINCISFKGQGEDRYYKIVREDTVAGGDPQVPFGIVSFEVHGSGFQANANENSYRFEDADRESQYTEKIVAIEEAATKLSRLPVPDRPSFSLATIPEAAGARCVYQCEMSIGDLDMEFTATVQMLHAADSVAGKHQWMRVSLEPRMETSVSYSETAWLLLDRDQWKSGRFAIRSGFLEADGFMFEFKDDQSTLPLDVALLDNDRSVEESHLLKKNWDRIAPRLPPAKPSMHQWLTLFFNADFGGENALQGFRDRITNAVVGARTRRIVDSRMLNVNGERVPGFIISVPELSGFSYEIRRSKAIPFGFERVEFSIPSGAEGPAVSLAAQLVAMKQMEPVAEVDLADLQSRVTKTDERLDIAKENDVLDRDDWLFRRWSVPGKSLPSARLKSVTDNMAKLVDTNGNSHVVPVEALPPEVRELILKSR